MSFYCIRRKQHWITMIYAISWIKTKCNLEILYIEDGVTKMLLTILQY